MRRRGAKRKQRDESQSSSLQEQPNREENHKPPAKTTAKSGATRATAAKSEPEPEFFEDQRNLVIDCLLQTLPIDSLFSVVLELLRSFWL
ncbi:hypothetical protein CRG98_034347 [Punica granatum]|uniref:Uncharacterized protein n=1 Tax=Punica granatum TaxID=22663 RepID=A0A2I0IMP5_PUNGR|nr:hypothetical protein CRG98_034347 [Punica granatum]